jgi:hypothetical protein
MRSSNGSPPLYLASQRRDGVATPMWWTRFERQDALSARGVGHHQETAAYPPIAAVPAALRRRKQWASNPSSDQRFALSRPPVIRLLPIIQMPDASDKRGVSVTFRPIDRFSLRFEGAEHMVRMVFDDIIVDTAPLRAALWARFNVNIRHTVSP